MDLNQWVGTLTIVAGIATTVSTLFAWLTFRLQKQTSKQENRIEQLEGVTTALIEQTVELRKQNEIMINQYELTRKITQKERMPVFIQITGSTVFDKKRIIQLRNVGTTAYNLKLHGQTSFDYDVRIYDSMVYPQGIIQIHIEYHNQESFYTLNFFFTIEFQGEDNKHYQQTIGFAQNALGYIVGPPNE